MNNTFRILIVDDDKQLLNTLKLLLKYEFSEIACLSNPNLIPETLQKTSFDAILLDMNFSTGKTSGNEGIYWLREIKRMNSDATVVMISAYANIGQAVEAMKEGAVDFILKPWENEKLIATLKTACTLNKTKEELAINKAINKQANEDLNKEKELIIGQSIKMQKVIDTIKMVAPTDANILIQGENGTGKEVVAREIHKASLRNSKCFVHVDLGSIVETLFESELFGHKKGAFTGAINDKKGRFEMANQGTLFLDEIANINIPLQGKLLSAIQNKEFFPVGSQRMLPVDVRLICATNRNLQEMTKESSFREDLLYRINTIQIDLPPLRERLEDIGVLAQYFVGKFNHKYNKECQMNDRLLKSLMSYSWPGNIRELQHTMEKAVILSQNDKIKAEDLNLGIKGNSKENTALKSWDEIEKHYLSISIAKHNGNLSEVARELELSRPAIYRKIKKHGL